MFSALSFTLGTNIRVLGDSYGRVFPMLLDYVRKLAYLGETVFPSSSLEIWNGYS